MTTRTLPLVLVAGLVMGGSVACKSSGGMRSATQTANLDDATIATRVKTALLNAPELQALEIQVQAENGVVTLTGAVPAEPQVARAMAVARTVGGVRDVRSTLKVGG